MSLGAFKDTLRMTTPSFPFYGKNITNILTYIHQLSTEDRSHLFNLIGISDEDELQALFFGNRMVKDDKASSTEYRLHKILAVYIPPVLLLLGTFGNIFAFLVLRHKSMSRLTTYLFLATLSISDCFVLVFGLLRMWIGEVSKFELRDQSDWLCKSIIYIGYITSNFSAWLLIAVTIERYLVIVHPLKALRWCSVVRAKKIILALFLFFVVVNLHFFWTVGLYQTVDGEPPKCDSSPEYRYLIYIIWPWVDALFYSFLPFLLILVFNILIISRVLQSNNGKEMGVTSTLRRFSGKRCSTSRSNYRLTVMLLSVSLTFILTTLPMNIGIICSFFWNQQSHDVKAMSKFRLFMTIAELLMYLNHSINFFLYCATGQKFRSKIMDMVCVKFGHVPNHDHSQHLYCSRGCSMSSGQNVVRKSVLETEV